MGCKTVIPILPSLFARWVHFPFRKERCWFESSNWRTISLGGTPATSLLQGVSLTMGWTGVLAISRGGTGLGIEHEVVAIAEIDKYAVASYEAIHGDYPNLGDISKIDPNDIPNHDLFTYSFPCQDISVAGKQKGLDMDSGTRSGLLWECQKVIDAKKPKYLLMENVKNIVGKKHKHNFDKWLEWLEQQGYSNYWQVLNAKDYGVPQNRERVFCVSILGEHEPYIFLTKLM